MTNFLRQRAGWLVVALAAWLACPNLQAEEEYDVTYVEAGRHVADDRDTRWAVHGGMIFSMEGFVQETTRALYDVTGSTYKQSDAERYDLNDFEMDGGDLLFGFSYEHDWKYFLFGMKVLMMNPESTGVAQRNYYLNVGDVTFNGQEYDNIKISQGTEFSAELFGALMEFDALATPCTFWINDHARLYPLLGVSLFSLIGTYEIEAGPARGVTQYQNPPEDFVVGGSAEGMVAGGLPELTGGVELAMGAEGGNQYFLRMLYGFLIYDGSTEYFTSSDERSKDADIDHWRLRFRASMDIPRESGRATFFGAEIELIDSWMYLEQTGDTPEEILARQERFDKEVDFSMTYGTIFVGTTL